MAHQFLIFAALATVARAGLLHGGAHLIQSPQVLSAPIARTVVAEPYDPNPQYSYGYDVQDPLTGDSHGQVETRSGDVVQGSYNLLEADGTRRVVDYTADPVNGFNAVVSKQGGVVAAPALARVAPVAVSAPLPTISPVGVSVPLPSPTPIVSAGPVAYSAPIASPSPIYGAPVSSQILRSVSPVISGAPWAGAPWAGAPVLRTALSSAPWQGASFLRSAPVW